jgi:hypothetical protein
MIAFYGLE